MAGQVIPGESSALTDEDSRKRDLVKKLLRSENKVIVDFAKHLVTVAFSAIGVVLALKDKWLGTPASFQQKLLLGIAIALFLAAGLLASLAAGVYRHGVSLSDYSRVDAELRRVARLRYRLTRVGFGLSVAGIIIVAAVAISA